MKTILDFLGGPKYKDKFLKRKEKRRKSCKDGGKQRLK